MHMKHALVTGASGGIGAACVRKLSAEGWRVTAAYLNSEAEALELGAETGAVVCRGDVASAEDAAGMAACADEPELLVCCAGVSSYGLFQDLSDAEWARLLAVNVGGARNCINAVLPSMLHRKRGSIILISSVWGVYGASCEAAYSATKAALIGLARSLAKELGPSGINVNCVAPGVIRTRMLDRFSDAELGELAEATPLCRLGSPEDVAEAVAFLASERASFITGQVLGVDGGFSL